MAIIPFYGSSDPERFAIERAAMDRPGLILDTLDKILPGGVVADIGAGNGFTASHLTSLDRLVVAVEPVAEMIEPTRGLPWVRADAEHLPFVDDSLAAAYATWAHFFSRGRDPSPGLDEITRTVRSGGVVAIVENLGGDEFTALASHEVAADIEFWLSRGFECEVVDTAFVFESLDDARNLLEFFFGERGRAGARLHLEFKAGVFTRTVTQPPCRFRHGGS